MYKIFGNKWRRLLHDCPIEVLELKKYITEVPNWKIEKPEISTKGQKDYKHDLTANQQEIYDNLEAYTKELSQDTWIKSVSFGFTVYSPKEFSYILI